MGTPNGGDFGSLGEHAIDLLKLVGWALFTVFTMFVTVLWWIGRSIFHRLDTIEQMCRKRWLLCEKVTQRREHQIGEMEGILKKRNHVDD